MTEPEDLKLLLNGIISISRDIRKLQALYTQFQATPSNDNLKILRDKESELDTLLELYEDRLDKFENCFNSYIIFEESEWGVTIDNPT